MKKKSVIIVTIVIFIAIVIVIAVVANDRNKKISNGYEDYQNVIDNMQLSSSEADDNIINDSTDKSELNNSNAADEILSHYQQKSVDEIVDNNLSKHSDMTNDGKTAEELNEIYSNAETSKDYMDIEDINWSYIDDSYVVNPNDTDSLAELSDYILESNVNVHEESAFYTLDGMDAYCFSYYSNGVSAEYDIYYRLDGTPGIYVYAYVY